MTNVKEITDTVFSTLQNYQENSGYYKELVAQGDKTVINLVLKTADAVLQDKKTEPLVQLNSIRLVKECMDSQNLEIVKALNKHKTLGHIFEISKFKSESDNDDRGADYFGTSTSKELQMVGNSIVRLSLECILFWSYLFEFDPQSQNQSQVSNFQVHYDALMKKGVKFPDQINYFKQVLKEMQEQGEIESSTPVSNTYSNASSNQPQQFQAPNASNYNYNNNNGSNNSYGQNNQNQNYSNYSQHPKYVDKFLKQKLTQIFYVCQSPPDEGQNMTSQFSFSRDNSPIDDKYENDNSRNDSDQNESNKQVQKTTQKKKQKKKDDDDQSENEQEKQTISKAEIQQRIAEKKLEEEKQNISRALTIMIQRCLEEIHTETDELKVLLRVDDESHLNEDSIRDTLQNLRRLKEDLSQSIDQMYAQSEELQQKYLQNMITQNNNLNVLTKDIRELLESKISLDFIQKTYIPDFQRKKQTFSSLNSDQGVRGKNQTQSDEQYQSIGNRSNKSNSNQFRTQDIDSDNDKNKQTINSVKSNHQQKQQHDDGIEEEEERPKKNVKNYNDDLEIEQLDDNIEDLNANKSNQDLNDSFNYSNNNSTQRQNVGVAFNNASQKGGQAKFSSLDAKDDSSNSNKHLERANLSESVSNSEFGGFPSRPESSLSQFKHENTNRPASENNYYNDQIKIPQFLTQNTQNLKFQNNFSSLPISNIFKPPRSNQLPNNRNENFDNHQYKNEVINNRKSEIEQQQIRMLSEQISTYEKQNHTLLQSLTFLKQQLNKEIERSSHIQKLYNQLSLKITENALKKTDNSDAIRENMDLRRDIGFLKQQLQSKENDERGLLEQLQYAQMEQKNIEKTLENLKRENDVEISNILRNSLLETDKHKLYMQEVHSYQMKLETFEKQNERIKTQFNLTKEELNRVNKQLGQLVAEMNSLREENNELHKKIIFTENCVSPEVKNDKSSQNFSFNIKYEKIHLELDRTKEEIQMQNEKIANFLEQLQYSSDLISEIQKDKQEYKRRLEVSENQKNHLNIQLQELKDTIHAKHNLHLNLNEINQNGQTPSSSAQKLMTNTNTRSTTVMEMTEQQNESKSFYSNEESKENLKFLTQDKETMLSYKDSSGALSPREMQMKINPNDSNSINNEGLKRIRQTVNRKLSIDYSDDNMPQKEGSNFNSARQNPTLDNQSGIKRELFKKNHLKDPLSENKMKNTLNFTSITPLRRTIDRDQDDRTRESMKVNQISLSNYLLMETRRSNSACGERPNMMNRYYLPISKRPQHGNGSHNKSEGIFTEDDDAGSMGSRMNSGTNCFQSERTEHQDFMNPYSNKQTNREFNLLFDQDLPVSTMSASVNQNFAKKSFQLFPNDQNYIPTQKTPKNENEYDYTNYNNDARRHSEGIPCNENPLPRGKYREQQNQRNGTGAVGTIDFEETILPQDEFFENQPRKLDSSFYSQLIYPYSNTGDYFKNRVQQKIHSGVTINYNQSPFDKVVECLRLQDELTRFQKLCLNPQGILYDNNSIQIGALSTTFYHNNKGFIKIALHIFNQSEGDIYEFSFLSRSSQSMKKFVNLFFQDITLWTKPELVQNEVIENNKKFKLELVSEILEIPYQIPFSQIEYSLKARRGEQYYIPLPFTINQFASFQIINIQHFKSKWKNHNENVIRSTEFTYSSEILQNSFYFQKIWPEIVELNSFQKEQHIAGVAEFQYGGIFKFIHLDFTDFLIQIYLKPLQQISFAISVASPQISQEERNSMQYMINSLIFLCKH